ncbi:MAG: hypothetical protein ACW99G_03860 [Candidatus Thorarchaeota archaeon]
MVESREFDELEDEEVIDRLYSLREIISEIKVEETDDCLMSEEEREEFLREVHSISYITPKTEEELDSEEVCEIEETQTEQNQTLNRAYQDQYYYFLDPETPRRYVQEAIQRLKYEGYSTRADSDIESLLNRLTSKKTIEYLRKTDRTRVHGSVINLLCDILKVSLKKFEGHIERIAGKNGHGGIRSPLFPSGDTLELLKARLMGIAVSDCYLPKTGTMSLYEGNLNRINRVKRLLDNFGVAFSSGSLVKREGDYAFYIASPMLNALRSWGIPAGDRTIQNYGLPKDSLNWSNLAIQGYLREMLAQEGNIDKNGVINWSRSHAFHDGKRGPEYEFQSKLSDNALQFLQESKKMRSHNGMVSEVSIPIGKLETMCFKSDEYAVGISNEILSLVKAYRNRLIDDEKALAERIGIPIVLNPVRVSYFTKSDRVSVRWQARISGLISKIRSALLIYPNHESKSILLQEWLERQPLDDVLRSKKMIESDGLRELLKASI